MIRYVDYTTYKVLESMVKDGLISGLPYSEFKDTKTLKEFLKRLNKAKK